MCNNVLNLKLTVFGNIQYKTPYSARSTKLDIVYSGSTMGMLLFKMSDMRRWLVRMTAIVLNIFMLPQISIICIVIILFHFLVKQNKSRHLRQPFV